MSILKQVFIGQYTESSGMTTKETEIPTIFFYKKKKKQIYKITVLNIFTGFVFICKRIFNLIEAQCDKGDEGKQASFFSQ